MKSGIFFISSTSTATLKLLGLLFVLQPTQHGLICASVAKRLKKPKQMSQATGFCRSAVLMTLCLQSFGFVSFKGNVDLDLPIYLIKGISFENLTMKLWKQSNYRKGNILVTVLWSCIGSASGWNDVGGGAPVMKGNVELLRAAKVLQDGRGGAWLWGGLEWD